MEDMTSFLEQPLDRDLYEPKKFSPQPKEPLRILVTDAGSKIAYNIIYQICSGNVFGPNQEIILHLLNSRGSIHHKSIALELEECGFPVYKDCVLSSVPAEAFKKVDVVIAIATFEELPGRDVIDALVYQMFKARKVAKYVEEYAKKDAKIIFTGPSTKALVVMLCSLRKFAPNFPVQNVTCVTTLDLIISKAMLGAKLKTTTDKIKNVVIWSATYPDVCNATVRMYPSNDFGALEMKDVPIVEALQDDAWIYTTFKTNIFRRTMDPDLLKYGKAVAMSAVLHMKILFEGTNNFDEIYSMGVISPTEKVYQVPPTLGFSFPVKTENGHCEIMKDVPYDVSTQLNILRVIFNLTNCSFLHPIVKVAAFILDYETTKKQVLKLSSKYFGPSMAKKNWATKYFVTRNPAEGVTKPSKLKGQTSGKSIAWFDDLHFQRNELSVVKSAIRFSSENLDGKEFRKDSNLINKNYLVSILSRKSSAFKASEPQPMNLFDLK